MHSKIILVDMDNTIAHFDGLYLENFKLKYPNKPFIPLEDRKTFYPADDYNKLLGIARTELKKIYEAPGFFLNLPIIPGAKEALNDMKTNGFNVFLCTAPVGAYENCVLEKFKWVEIHLGREWTEKIIFTNDKTLVKGNFLIDDKPKITGLNPTPEWTQIIFDQPYNRDIVDKDRLVMWSDWNKKVLGRFTTEIIYKCLTIAFKIILVDMDNTIAHFDGLYLENFKLKYPTKPFIPLEERKTFYPADDYNKLLGINRNELKQIYEAPGFFVNLPIIPGAKEALNEMKMSGLNVFLCTAPVGAYENCVLEKFKWVETHLGREWTEKIIFTNDKTLIKGNFLIDDKPKITGLNPTPEWTQIIFDQPYNRDIVDKDRLKVWSNWKKLFL